MNVLQSVENYIHVDMTRIFNNVLLQQTQQTDSNGEPTIGMYSSVLNNRAGWNKRAGWQNSKS